MVSYKQGIIGLGLLLGGCMNLAPTASPPQYMYLLDTLGKVESTKQTSSYVLVVTTPITNPAYHTRKMAYKQASHSLAYFSRNQWVTTPSEMLLPLLVQTLQQSQYFKAVVASPYWDGADLRLDTELVALQQEFQEDISFVRVIIHARLIAVSQRRILATQQFTARVVAPTADPKGGVIAANQAVSQILSELTQFVIQAVKSVEKEGVTNNR